MYGLLSLYLWYINIFDYSAHLPLYCSQILDFYIKENIIYMYLLGLLCFITVLHSPEALIHCIRVLSSIYKCYTSNIISQIICFSSCLKISGPRVGPDPALTRPRPWGPGSGPAKISRPWPGPAPGQCTCTWIKKTAYWVAAWQLYRTRGLTGGKDDRNAGVLLHAKRYQQCRSTTPALREPDGRGWGWEPWDKFEVGMRSSPDGQFPQTSTRD